MEKYLRFYEQATKMNLSFLKVSDKIHPGNLSSNESNII